MEAAVARTRHARCFTSRMSEFDTIAGAFAEPALMEWHGDQQAVRITPKSGQPFTVDAILGLIRGAEQFSDVGQTTRLLTATVQVNRSDFDTAGITEPPMMSSVDAYGLEKWAVDMTTTEWGAVIVKLGLQRETLAREWQARRNAAV